MRTQQSVKSVPNISRTLNKTRHSIHRCDSDIPATAGAAASCTRDDVALVVDSCNSREVCRDTEDRVEFVGLPTGLRGDGVGCSLRIGAGGLSSLVSTTAVHERVAHELRDDVDVLSRAVIVRS